MSAAMLLQSECLLPQFDPMDYVRVNKIGSGVFAPIQKYEKVSASNNDLPKYVAVKMIDAGSAVAFREPMILKECQHKNILQLYYWQTVKLDGDDCLQVFTELCDCNLKEILISDKLNYNSLKQMCYQMIEGCDYLHSKYVVHRDINPSNILISRRGNEPELNVKMSGFGFARFVPPKIDSSFTYETVGTRAYTSPEVMRAFNKESAFVELQFPYATDIFSLGVVIFEMFQGRRPFSVEQLGRSSFDVEKLISTHVPDTLLLECLIQMLTWNPKLRPRARQLFKYFKTSREESTVSKYDLDMFETAEPIGKGLFGAVTKYILKPGFNADVPSSIAVKVVTFSYASALLSRKNDLTNFSHPNIVQLFGWKVVGSKVYLLMPLCNGDLQSFRKRFNKPPTLRLINSLYLQLAKGLSYLHEKEIVHGNIKPTNALVVFPSENDNAAQDHALVIVKLSDFGLSSDQKGMSDWEYGAPETLRFTVTGEKYDGKAADVFSLGCLFAFIIIAEPLFSRYQLLQGIFDVRAHLNDKIETIDGVKPLLRRMLTWLSEKRHPIAMIQHILQVEDEEEYRHRVERKNKVFDTELMRSTKPANIVLVGPSGGGKTSTIIHLIGHTVEVLNQLKVSKFSSETRATTEFVLKLITNSEKDPANGLRLGIVDTPGLDDTNGPEQDARNLASIRRFLDKTDNKLPNLVLFVTRGDSVRDFGPYSQFTRCLKQLSCKKLNLTDGTNLIIVLTHAYNLEPSNYSHVTQQKINSIQAYVNLISGFKDVPVVFLDNMPPQHAQSKGDFTRLPDGTVQPKNLFKKIADQLAKKCDFAAKAVVREFFARNSSSSFVKLDKCTQYNARMVGLDDVEKDLLTSLISFRAIENLLMQPGKKKEDAKKEKERRIPINILDKAKPKLNFELLEAMLSNNLMEAVDSNSKVVKSKIFKAIEKVRKQSQNFEHEYKVQTGAATHTEKFVLQFILSTAEINKVNLSKLSLAPPYAEALSKLNIPYDGKEDELYEDFFQNFGIGIVTSATLGGELTISFLRPEVEQYHLKMANSTPSQLKNILRQMGLAIPANFELYMYYEETLYELVLDIGNRIKLEFRGGEPNLQNETTLNEWKISLSEKPEILIGKRDILLHHEFIKQLDGIDNREVLSDNLKNAYKALYGDGRKEVAEKDENKDVNHIRSERQKSVLEETGVVTPGTQERPEVSNSRESEARGVETRPNWEATAIKDSRYKENIRKTTSFLNSTSGCFLQEFDPENYKKGRRLNPRGAVREYRSSLELPLLPKSVACKKITLPAKNSGEKWRREYQILTEAARHQNIVKLYFWQVVTGIDGFSHLLLYSELCDQNLKSFLQENKLQPYDVKSLGRQLLHGCEYLHNKNIVHRDIKPENILVNKGDTPSKAVMKLADFGLARMVPGSGSTDLTDVETYCYASPEMIQGLENEELILMMNRPDAPDIFSLGVVIYEMLTREKSFTSKMLRSKFFDGGEDIISTKISFDETLKRVLISMLQRDPEKRPRISHVLREFTYDYEMELREAIIDNDLDTVKRILDDVKDTGDLERKEWKWGEAPLHAAAAKRRNEMISLMIEAGFDVNSYGVLDDHNRFTSLHWAVECNHSCTVNLLLNLGADFTLEGRMDHVCCSGTALDWAKTKGLADIVQLLEQLEDSKFKEMDSEAKINLRKKKQKELEDAENLQREIDKKEGKIDEIETEISRLRERRDEIVHDTVKWKQHKTTQTTAILKKQLQEIAALEAMSEIPNTAEVSLINSSRKKE